MQVISARKRSLKASELIDDILSSVRCIWWSIGRYECVNNVFVKFWDHVLKFIYDGKWFEPRGISYQFNMIVRVKVVFRKTFVGDWSLDYLSGSHLQSQAKSRRQTNVKDKDQERCTESSVLTVRLLILGRLAETWRQDWLNTNERPRTVISGITFLNTID